MPARALGLCFLVLLLAACRDEQAGPKNRGAGQLAAPPQAKVLDAAPADLTFRSGKTWAGGSIVYLGARVVPARPKAGDQVTLTHYFQALKPPPQGYGFFVHLLDSSSGQFLANLDHEIQGGALPLGSWPVGKVIEDTHSLQLPAGMAGGVRLAIGFWQGNSRLPVDDPATSAGENRMAGPLLEAQGPALPEYHVGKTAKPPKIDGELSDPAWKDASAVELVGSYDGAKPATRTTAKLLYDDQNLYLSFDCEDPDVWGTLLQRDEAIYTQEVVELFVDANGDGRTYNEMEVSPHNTIFDAYFPARRQGMDLTFDAQMQTAVKVRGTIDDPSDRDDGWSVEIKLPISRLAEVPNNPPKKGDRWRFNLFRLEHLERRNVEGQAFSPLFVGDFHHLPRFGWLVFE